jgi:hypothetical protein
VKAAPVSSVSPGVQGGITAPGTGERLFADIGSAGAATTARTVTRIAVFGRDGRNHSVRLVPGAWELPEAVPGQPEGISWDGSRVVLVARHDPGRFLAVSTGEPHAAPRVIVEPHGRFIYDGLAVDGTQLFLTQLAKADGTPTYRIRRYDITSRRLDPTPVVVKNEDGEQMVGEPVARASAPDFIYTVYARTMHPFVHALESRGQYSLCLELPANARKSASAVWSARRLASGDVAIWNRLLHKAYRLEAGQMTPVAYAGVVK